MPQRNTDERANSVTRTVPLSAVLGVRVRHRRLLRTAGAVLALWDGDDLAADATDPGGDTGLTLSR
jgi:hypothetical protein